MEIILIFAGFFFSKGYARTILISTSKMRNRIATKKNWNENGRCEGDIVLNPHSNWLDFSLYDFSVFFVMLIIVISPILMVKDVSSRIDVLMFLFFFLIGN
jgi:hypothetical protein